MLLAKLMREALLPRVMIEGTDLHLITTHAVALDSLVLVRMVEPLDSGVALGTLDAPRAVLPPFTALECLTVLRRILEQVWRSAEVTRVMRVDATFRVVTILFRRAPARFVEEHEENVSLLLRVNLIESLIEAVELEKALRHEVILDALVLEVAIHCLDELQVSQSETNQLIRRFVLIESDDKRAVKPIVAEKLQLLRVVVPRQCLL